MSIQKRVAVLMLQLVFAVVLLVVVFGEDGSSPWTIALAVTSTVSAQVGLWAWGRFAGESQPDEDLQG